MKKDKAFSLIEVIVTLSLFVILASFTTITMLRPQIKSSIDSTVTQVVSDLKSQQMKAMTGDMQGQASTENYGIRFENNRYILFKGSSYNAGDPNNIPVNLENGSEFTNINFPLSQVVFLRRSGEISGFLANQDNITISHSSGLSKVLTLNKYGSTSIN